LPVGTTLPGPAIVEEAGSCTVVPPGWSLRLLPQDVLVLERA
jgi:N-methylhydantoinase A/oxoprolinase/acetone carboxylase beta subunit